MNIAMLKLLENILKANLIPFHRPYKLTMSVTDSCNHKCRICGIWKKRSTLKELSVEEYRSFFMAYPGFSWIDVTGGEVFLRDDIDELFSCIIEECPNLYMLHFPTNGMLTSVIEKSAAMVSRKNVKLVVTVSIDGPEEIHDELRGVPGAWKRAVETLKLLRSMEGVEAYIGMTISDANADLIRKTYESLAVSVDSLSYKDFHVNFMNKSQHFFNNLTLESPEKEKILSSVKELCRLKGIPRNHIEAVEYIYLRQIARFFSSGFTPVSCASLRSSLFIDPYGEVYPCTIFNKKLGSVRDFGYSVLNILDTDISKETKCIIKAKKCPNCWTPCEAYQSIFMNILKPWNFIL